MAEQEQEQTILKLIASKGFISYNKIIAKKFGIEEAIVLGELCSIYDYFNYKEFYINQERISDDTALSVKQIRAALNNLVTYKIITVTKKGLPCKNWYTINGKTLNSLLSKKDKGNKDEEKKSESNENGEQDVPKEPSKLGKFGTTSCEEKDALLRNKNRGIRIQNKNTPEEGDSLRSSPSAEASETDEQETQGNMNPLETKQKDSKAETESECQEEKETGKNSDSQNPLDGPAPWETPAAKKSKPKVPLPDREPVNDIEKVFKEYMRVFDSAKQEGLISGNYCWGAANYGARVKTVKFWLKEHSADEIKQALWLAKKDNFCLKTLGLSFMPILSQKVFPRLLEGRVQTLNSSFPQKHREAFIDGKRDYSNTDDW